MIRKIERMDDCYNDSPLWARQDEDAAMCEGWYISNSTEGCDEIQRYPWSDIFPSDAEAIAHVYWKAGTGSDLHRRAIAYTLRDGNSWAYERPLKKYKEAAVDEACAYCIDGTVPMTNDRPCVHCRGTGNAAFAPRPGGSDNGR